MTAIGWLGGTALALALVIHFQIPGFAVPSLLGFGLSALGACLGSLSK